MNSIVSRRCRRLCFENPFARFNFCWWKISRRKDSGSTDYGRPDHEESQGNGRYFRVMILSVAVLYFTALYCTVLSWNVLYCTVLYCTVLYCTTLYCTVLYCTVLHYTVLYCTVLYYTVLYCIALYCSVLYCTVLTFEPAHKQM